MHLPPPRGPVSSALVDILSGPVRERAVLPVSDDQQPQDDALSLWILHEQHYRGFDDVAEEWEWAPALMPLRHRLERDLERRLRRRFADAGAAPEPASPFLAALTTLIETHEGPSLARHVQRHASRPEVVELLQQRSIYHLKEADPTAWVVPRLEPAPKAALMQVQYDEYGVGDPDRLHHRMFARGMAASGMDSTYGAYAETATVAVLEQNNALSLIGLHRRLRGAAVGHLAAVEATSSIPSRQLAQGLCRLGFPEEMVAYYDEHVEADAVHEQLAIRDVCGALVREEPAQRDEVLWGAWTCLDLESRTATDLLERWSVA